MTRLSPLLIAFVLFLVACGTAATDTTVSTESQVAATPDDSTTVSSEAPVATVQAPDENDGSESDDVDDSSDITDPPEEPTVVPDGPAAPNFTLVLDDGSTFELAAASRPVMLVFWAEW